MIIFTLAKKRLINFTNNTRARTGLIGPQVTCPLFLENKEKKKIICMTFDGVQYFCRIKSMAVLSAVGGIKEAAAGMTQGIYNNICAFLIQEL